MMNTIMETDHRFGVLMYDPSEGQVATVGCCAELIRMEKLPDDRMHILTLGQQRFRVLEFTREKPYLVGLVEWIEDKSSGYNSNLHPLADDVKNVLQDVVRLSRKLTDQDIDLPDDLPSTPLELSYWVASNLHGVALEQQLLLELENTEERLEREKEILLSTRNHLAARSALKDVLD
jgi:ATP-dependent Lon protease